MDLSGKTNKISICIPAYSMSGRGAEFLDFNLDLILDQTYKNYEVIVSDHSEDNLVHDICQKYLILGMNIKYLRNLENRGNASININNCIKNSTGDIIKILFQDDFLYYKNSLFDIAEYFKVHNPMWLASGCCHTIDGHDFYRYITPQYTEDIITGNNIIGSPSVISIKKTENMELFDPEYKWLMDCDYYRRMYDNHGVPHYLNKTNVVIRNWEGQLTQKMGNDEKDMENRKILIKYNYN